MFQQCRPRFWHDPQEMRPGKSVMDAADSAYSRFGSSSLVPSRRRLLAGDGYNTTYGLAATVLYLRQALSLKLIHELASKE